MRIKKTPNFDFFQKKIKKNIKQSLLNSGNAVLLAMKKRIKSGKDHQGSNFKPLNPNYQKRKAAQGKKSMFEFSGELLRSFTWSVKPVKSGFVLKYYFDNDKMKERAQYNIDNGRDFVNISKKEIDIIKNELNKK